MDIKEFINLRTVPEPNTGCWLWTHSERLGYGRFWIKSVCIAAHRASYEAYKGKITNGLWVLHKCDTPSCVNPDHLFLGTSSDNQKDSYQKGRSRSSKQFGELNTQSKLTAKIVNKIRSEYKKDSRYGRQKELAQKYKIARSTINQIIKGYRWTCINE